MWLFLNNAFISIVDERAKTTGKRNMRPAPSDRLVVRARARADIKRVFGPDTRVRESHETDYMFRALIRRDHVARVIAECIREIDYGNFKDSVPFREKDRKVAYSRVWGVMLALQPASKFDQSGYLFPDWLVPDAEDITRSR